MCSPVICLGYAPCYCHDHVLLAKIQIPSLANRIMTVSRLCLLPPSQVALVLLVFKVLLFVLFCPSGFFLINKGFLCSTPLSALGSSLLIMTKPATLRKNIPNQHILFFTTENPELWFTHHNYVLFLSIFTI